MAENLALVPLTKGSAVASGLSFIFRWAYDRRRSGSYCSHSTGGSVRDDEVIKSADDANLTMAFTGIRHFRH